MRFFGASLLVLLVGFSLYYVKLAGVEGLIIIRFTGGRGADFLGSKYDALGMLFAGTAITGLNACLTGILHGRNPVLARITGMVTLGITLLIVVAISCIISVN
ncbi:MAG: hypothetical protein EXS60_00595 [Candidatus Pacebacteria bacterium]|nr:hypothetical protein [Candidatus Paceibacterota bacterium]